MTHTHLDMAGLVGDEAAVPADVSLLAWPEAHSPPTHCALGAPGETHVTCHNLDSHLQLDVLGNKGVVHVDVQLGPLLLELPPLCSLEMGEIFVSIKTR